MIAQWLSSQEVDNILRAAESTLIIQATIITLHLIKYLLALSAASFLTGL